MGWTADAVRKFMEKKFYGSLRNLTWKVLIGGHFIGQNAMACAEFVLDLFNSLTSGEMLTSFD